MRIWDLEEKIEEAVLRGHTKYVSSIVITSNNKYIVSGSWDKTLIIWNFQDKTKYAILQGHSYAVTSLALTSDNKYIVSGGKDKTMRI